MEAWILFLLDEGVRTLEKKQFIQQVIESFEQHTTQLPNELDQLFKRIKGKLKSSSTIDIESEASAVVTSSADELPYDPDKISILLYEAFPIMEKMAKEAQENQYELLQATNELRGELGLATDPPFPE